MSHHHHPTFQGFPPAHSASDSYVGLPVAAAARISMQLVASLAHATTSMVRHPTSTPVLEMAKGIGRIELQRNGRWESVSNCEAEVLPGLFCTCCPSACALTAIFACCNRAAYTHTRTPVPAKHSQGECDASTEVGPAPAVTRPKGSFILFNKKGDLRNKHLHPLWID